MKKYIEGNNISHKKDKSRNKGELPLMKIRKALSEKQKERLAKDNK